MRKARVYTMSTKKLKRSEKACGVAHHLRPIFRLLRMPTPAERPASEILWRMAVAVLTLMVAGISAWGQATTSVRGTVVDPTGKAVAGANVLLANSESKTERTTVTGEQGEYQFLFVPPGTYKLAVTASGFRRYEQTDLQLLVN